MQFFLRKALWKMRTEEKKIWLTFDDGPIPGVTPWVLDVLDEYDAKATFFCVGENVVKHEKIFHSIIEKGHAVANHSYHHLNGWRTSNEIYFEDVERCNGLLRSKLFRPPYGKLRPSQYMNLGEKYSIVMWDVLTGDFDTKITREKCLENALQYSRPGSIVLFHDSLKARERMQYALPKFLEHFKKDGFSFERLESGVA
ncbi:MAG TPA: polysaccharide deacetylase family protein [Bacteroidia bacterium]